jgi:hypothetical protein
MANELIDDFQKRLTADISDGNTFVLSQALIAELDLTAIPMWAFPKEDINIQGAKIERVTESQLEITGAYTNASFGAIDVAFDITAPAAQLACTVQFDLPTPPDFRNFLNIARIELVSSAIDSFIAAAFLAGFKFFQTSSDLELELNLSGASQLTVLGLTVTVSLKSAVVQLNPPQLSSFSASIQMRDLAMVVMLPAEGDLRLEVIDASDVTIELIVNALGISLPPLPPLPFLAKGLDTLSIESIEGQFQFGGKLQWSGIGSIIFSFSEKDGTPGVVALIYPEDGMRFKSLDIALAPLDSVLNNLVTFDSPAIILSSLDSDAFSALDSANQWTTIAVEQGISFCGQLKLASFGLDLIGALLGKKELPFKVPVTPDFSNMEVTVTLPDAIHLLGGDLTVSGFKLSLTPDPLDVSAQAQATLVLFGKPLPTLELHCSFTPPDKLIVSLEADKWQRPAGLPVEIDKLGLQIEVEDSVVTYGFFGTINLSSDSLSVAANFFEGTVIPSSIIAKSNGDISLGSLLKDITGLNLPLDFGPTLQNISIYIVMNPEGDTIIGHLYSQGLGVSGSINFQGVKGNLTLSADSKRFDVQAALQFDLKGSVGPLQLSSGGLSLGSIQLNTGFNAEVGIDIDEVGDSHVTVAGSFSIVGVAINIPSIEIKIDSLEHFPEALLSYISKNANTLFKALLSDASKWLLAITNKLITGLGKDVANVLRIVFDYTDASKIANEIKNIFNPDDVARNLQVALFTNPQITVALHDLGLDTESAGKILKDVLDITDGALITSLLTNAGFIDVDNAIKNMCPGFCALIHGCVKAPDIGCVQAPDIGCVRLPCVKL